MKKPAFRTLGAAALGAAFVVAGAGGASAVAVPVDAVAGSLPSGIALDSVTDALPAVQEAAGGIIEQRQPGSGSDLSAPDTNLLGGLPTGTLPLVG
ncbi:MAG TPA: hypothetical protein VN520_17200 [Streptomyces sp.]|uniref:hypothetical protein n=1 Tax=Streptomyces sp. TaxID=1931 RepID=UPI002D1C97F3|nr:hypothetical protein [Streptomyces sp.]HWU08093.1 hypothetical protein [Streptomyces sp.]